MGTITVSVRDVYGRTTVYAVCERAKLLASLAGTKTLTMDALRVIRRLGFEIAEHRPALAGVAR